MKKFLSLFITLITALIFSGSAVASYDTAKEFKLPSSAVKLGDGVYSLGDKVDPSSGKKVQGWAFLHPKSLNARSNAAGSGGKATSCYAYLSSGLKWKTLEPWQLDPSNSQGLTENFLLANTAANLQKWETAANANIFGDGSVVNGLVVDNDTPDGNNEVTFAPIVDQGVIAVTIVWGYYGGPPKTREIVEWDQVYDDQDFSWSTIGEAGKMDYENISTHEIGHAAGMGHPDNSCVNETMYRYAAEGETKKRDLSNGDISGIDKLY